MLAVLDKSLFTELPPDTWLQLALKDLPLTMMILMPLFSNWKARKDGGSINQGTVHQLYECFVTVCYGLVETAQKYYPELQVVSAVAMS